MKKRCACGCGKYANDGKRYVLGHHMRCLSEKDKKRYEEGSIAWISKLTQEERREKFGSPGKKNPRYKNGYTLKIRYCKDCGIKLEGFSSKPSKRCNTCNNRRQLSNPIIRKKISETHKALSKTPEGRRRIEEHAKKISGENSCNWIDGRSYKPYDRRMFSERKKAEIRKRDEYICLVCGMTEEEHLVVYGTVLNVHHIDYNKYNCCDENLVSTCKGCNARVNFNRGYWQEYFKERMKQYANIVI